MSEESMPVPGGGSGLQPLPNEQHLVVDGWEVASAALSLNGEAVYLTLNSALGSVRVLLKPVHARFLGRLLLRLAHDVQGVIEKERLGAGFVKDGPDDQILFFDKGKVVGKITDFGATE